MAIFPSFWFEGNLSFGTVEDLDDLHVVFERYKGNLTPKGVLDRATCVSDEYLEKWQEIRPEATKRIESGLRREHIGGKKTLREFFLEHNIEFNF